MILWDDYCDKFVRTTQAGDKAIEVEGRMIIPILRCDPPMYWQALQKEERPPTRQEKSNNP